MTNPYPYPGFIGGSYTARSTNFDAQKTINLYPEQSESGTSKSIAMLLGCPGLLLWLTLPDLPIRGALRISDTKAIVVAGGTIFLVTNNATYTVIGTIVPGVTPVNMRSNSLFAMIATGSFGYFVDLASYAVTLINDPDFLGADTVAFINGRFIFNKPLTQQYQWTNVFGEDIDSLAFSSAEGAPDLLVGVMDDHKELWLFGATSTEPAAATDDNNAPFQVIQGAFLEQGIAAKNSIAKTPNDLFWLSADDRGQGIVQRARGYSSMPISDHGMDFAVASYGYIADAVGYTYQQEGHMFYMLTFPSAQATWCWDTKTELWHQRAWRDPITAALKQHRSICHMAFANLNIVGDWQNGNLYSLDLDVYTDNGNILPAIRQCPHIANGDNWQFFYRLWIDMETGVGLTTGQGSDPQVFLEWSDDGGASFPNSMLASIGKIGARRTRATFRRLGKSRDRVFRVTITDPVKRVLIDAGLHYKGGVTP